VCKLISGAKIFLLLAKWAFLAASAFLEFFTAFLFLFFFAGRHRLIRAAIFGKELFTGHGKGLRTNKVWGLFRLVYDKHHRLA